MYKKPDNPDDIATGERLRGIREDMKMNREDFSEKIDITDSFLGQIERGEKSLSAKTLRKIVRYTGVSADYLFFLVRSVFIAVVHGESDKNDDQRFW